MTRKMIGWALAAVALALLAVTAGTLRPGDTALAATLTVTKTNDTDDGTCDADCSLREAVNAAVDGDVIALGAGTYVLSIGGASEDAGATGDLDIDVDLTITGAGSGSTTIDADELDRVLHVAAADDSLTLDGLTVQFGAPPAGQLGGGILSVGPLSLDDVVVTSNDAGSGGGIAFGTMLTMVDSAVDGNGAVTQGGGVFGLGGDSTVTITDSSISGNVSATEDGGGFFFCCDSLQLTVTGSDISGNTTGDEGGGIFFCCGGETLATNIVITDSTIEDNVAIGDGGGLYSCCDTGPPVNIMITDSAFTDNFTAAAGGGIYDCCGSGTTTITGSTISGNIAGSITTSGTGAGLYSDANTLVITNSTFEFNTVLDGDGGAIYSGSPDATIDSSTIYGNVSTSIEFGDGNGAGIYNDGTLDIVNSTLSDNFADGDGGSIYNDATLDLLNVTITLSDAFDTSEGSGLYSGGTATIRNTIIAGNEDDECSTGLGGTITSGGYNVQGDTTCGLTGTGDQTANAFLGILADNGGPTLTHELEEGSPAIDAVVAGCPPPADDQRGIARPQGVACDAGAFELESEGEQPTSTPDPTATATAGAPSEGGGGNIGGAPDFRPSATPDDDGQTPIPAVTSTPVRGEGVPRATSTSPTGGTGAGGVGPDGIGAPDTGTGGGGTPGGTGGAIAALAALAMVGGALAFSAARRVRR